MRKCADVQMRKWRLERLNEVWAKINYVVRICEYGWRSA